MAVIVKETTSALPAVASRSSYVDWGAIIAGTVFAVAISSLFLAFGSAIGLSMTSPFRGEGFSAVAVLIAFALWLIWVQISSAAAGGYLTGRLLRRRGEVTQHENEVRDGSHGLVVWALGTIIAAGLAAMVVSGAAKVGGLAAMAAGDRVDYIADTLLRNETANAPVLAPAAIEQMRGETGRILQAGALQGDITDPDRAQLARLVSGATGLPAADAEKRVNDFVTQAKVTADKARKAGIIAAFVTAASLLISALAAFWAACSGGQHRDEGLVWTRLTWWRQTEASP
ncbi:MAG: hypothetical protein AB7F76_09590 [Parvibaculaceae bacterium]